MAKKQTESKQKLSPRGRFRVRRVFLALEALLLVLVVGGLFIWSKLDMIQFEELAPIRINKLTPETEESLSGFMTVALFGSDNRVQGQYEVGNSDTIIIASINNDTKEVKLASVYRDTFLDVGGGELRKCNYAYGVGGVSRAMEMLNTNLDLNIQDYVAVDFRAMVHVVDALGGLEMTITDEEAYHMNNSYIHFVEESTGVQSSEVTGGTHLLDGVQVLSYCRVRYTAGNDFRRTERQREVLGLIAEKMKHMNILQANEVINAAFPEISTNLGLEDILNLVPYMMSYQISDTHGFPFAMRTGTFGAKGSIVVPCTLESNVHQLHEFLYGNVWYTPSENVTSISNSIVNYTGFTESSALDYGY